MYEMKKPRCGVPDVDIIGGHQKRYATSGKWRKTNLKYYMTYGDDMSHDHQAKIMAKAFKYWSEGELKRLTPAPRTTLRTTPRTTLQTTPTDYPK